MSKNFKNKKPRMVEKVYPETSMEQIRRLVRQFFDDFKSCFRVT